MVKRKLVTNQDVMTQCFYEYRILMWAHIPVTYHEIKLIKFDQLPLLFYIYLIFILYNFF